MSIYGDPFVMLTFKFLLSYSCVLGWCQSLHGIHVLAKNITAREGILYIFVRNNYSFLYVETMDSDEGFLGCTHKGFVS